MDLSSLEHGGSPVGSRAHQRMPEPHPHADLDQPRRDRGSRRVGPDAEQLGRAPQQRRVADGLRRRHRQQLPRLDRKRLQPAREALLEATGQRDARRQTESARDLGQPTRQLDQCERVAAGFPEDPGLHPLVEGTGHRRVEKPAGIVGGQPLDHHLRQPLEDMPVVGLAPREHQPDTLCEQSARDETERERDARSSHCASSITHTSGRCSATSASRLRTANPTRKRSGAGPSRSPNAVPSASLCGPGRCPTRSSIGTHKACNPANASSISDSTPAARTMRQPAATAERCPSRTVLPTPASPRNTSTRLWPPRTLVTSRSSTSRSLMRLSSPGAGRSKSTTPVRIISRAANASEHQGGVISGHGQSSGNRPSEPV